jgi:transcriptional regulator with XRE-family HTH domain
MSTVGERLRRLREQHGMTQSELAARLPLSGSYVSLIESGKRAPKTRVLELLARELGCTVDYLRSGRGSKESRDLDLELRFAELALHAGEARAARDRFRRVLAVAQEVGYDDACHAARWGLSRSEEVLGNLEAALRGMESLSREEVLLGTVSRTAVLNRLCRTLHKLGDIARAVEIGEKALHELGVQGALDNDEAAELAATLVFCYYDRGDLALAQLSVQELMERAEQGGSSRARAAAYWNAGIVAEARGDYSGARTYAERALALYSVVQHDRRLAQVRVDCAWILLRQENPDHKKAADLLKHALSVLVTVGAPRDVAHAEIELARCHLLDRRLEQAVETATTALDRLSSSEPLESARGFSILAHAHALMGDADAAETSFRRAADRLRLSEKSRQSGSVWRELADLMAAQGCQGDAMIAYQAASDAAGVTGSALTLPG